MIIDFAGNGGGSGSGGSVVTYTQLVSAGTELGRIVIDGASNSIFAPSGEGDSHYYIVDSLSEVTDPVEGDVAYIKPLSATGYEFELDYELQDPQLCNTYNPALSVMATETRQVGLEIMNDDTGTDDWYLTDGKPGDYVIFTDTADTDNYVIVKVAGLTGTTVRYQVAGFGMASVSPVYTSSTVTVTVPSDDPFMVYTGGVWVSMKNDTDLSNYYTSAETDTAIAEATSAFTTSAQVETQITAATSAFTTSGDVQTMIDDGTSGISAHLTEVEQVTSRALVDLDGRFDNYTTSGDVQTMIDTSTDGMVTSATVTTIWKGTQSEYDALSPDYDNNTVYFIV